MKTILLAVTLLVPALARPDIGINYLPANHGQQAGTHQTYQYNYNAAAQTPFTAYTSNGNGGSSGHYTSHGSSSSSSSAFSGGHQVHQDTVTNSVYFYDAPEDEIIPAASIRVEGGAGAQHNRVIFIKAPSYQTQQISNIGGSVSGSEEKTRIYVLAKRPEAQQDVIINTGSGSHVAKPEVVYIKYNTQQDAEQQILASIQGQNTGHTAQSVGSDHAFVQTIRDTVDVRAQGPIVHTIGGSTGHTAEAGAQILGLHGGLTNGQQGASSGSHNFNTQTYQSSSSSAINGNNGGLSIISGTGQSTGGLFDASSTTVNKQTAPQPYHY